MSTSDQERQGTSCNRWTAQRYRTLQVWIDPDTEAALNQLLVGRIGTKREKRMAVVREAFQALVDRPAQEAAIEHLLAELALARRRIADLEQALSAKANQQ